MKKITATGEDISFKVDGKLTLDITEEGVIVPDDVAATVSDRLGGQIMVEAVDAKEAAKAAAAKANADAPTKITKDTTEDEDKALALAAGVTEEAYALAVEESTVDGTVDVKALKKALTAAVKDAKEAAK